VACVSGNDDVGEDEDEEEEGRSGVRCGAQCVHSQCRGVSTRHSKLRDLTRGDTGPNLLSPSKHQTTLRCGVLYDVDL
jgi:hypothetical protein